jgi:Clostripain family
MSESINQNYEWLVIFLVYNNNFYDINFKDCSSSEESQDTKDYYTMEEQTAYILDQIRNTRYSENVKTVFVEAEIKNNNCEAVASISAIRKKWGAWLSKVDGMWRNPTSIEIMTDISSPENLLKKLVAKYKANKHMIITAGHGSITGINYYLPRLKQKAKDNPEIKKLVKEKVNIPWKGEQENKLSEKPAADQLFLYNQELNTVLKNVFGQKKLDVLVMYNCLMQNVFTQFEFKDTVDWLVAPLSGISIPGFNYPVILNEISINPDISGQEVARLFIDSIRTGNGYSFFREDIENTWKIAAVKLNADLYKEIQQKFDELFTMVKAVAAEPRGQKLIICIDETLRYSFNYGAHSLNTIKNADIGIFLEFFKRNILEKYKRYESLVSKILELQSHINLQTEKFCFEGQNFYKDGRYYYIEQDPEFKKYIANLGLLLPVDKINKGILASIYIKSAQSNERNESEFKSPSFLKSDSYAAVVNKIFELSR